MRSRISSHSDSQFPPCWRLGSPRMPRRGVAATEFAIVVPVLITILLGAIDFGRFSYYTIAIANAARCGAAYASLNPYGNSTQTAWTAGVNLAVTNELSQSTAFDASKLTVVITNVTESGGLGRTSVQVTYPFTTIIKWSSLPSSTNLQTIVVMRVIR